MKCGKISGNVLNRSIYKKIKKTGGSASGGGVTAMQTVVDEYNNLEYTGQLALYRAFNRLWSRGSRITGIELALTLSDRVSEKKLADLMELIDVICREHDIQILGGHTEVADVISRSVVSVCAIGESADRELCYKVTKKDEPFLIQTKHIALGTTALFADANRSLLSKRLPAWLIDEATSFVNMLSCHDECEIAINMGACFIKPVGSRGIFGALWELGEALNCGMEISLRDIPIKQESVEIFELLDKNPYEADSCGSILIVVNGENQANRLIDSLNNVDIAASIIGRLNASNDRVLLSKDERRYIDRV